jgi:hypothetical protein
MSRRLTLYSKPGCHLCDDLRAHIEAVRFALNLTVENVDIGSDPELTARYRHAIPVLLCDGREIARGRVDRTGLLAALGELPAPGR